MAGAANVAARMEFTHEYVLPTSLPRIEIEWRKMALPVQQSPACRQPALTTPDMSAAATAMPAIRHSAITDDVATTVVIRHRAEDEDAELYVAPLPLMLKEDDGEAFHATPASAIEYTPGDTRALRVLICHATDIRHRHPPLAIRQSADRLVCLR